MPLPKTIDDFARAFALTEAQGLEGYVDGGAGAEVTLRRNREAWDAIELLPRVLRGTGHRDLSTTVLGSAEAAPVMIAPVGFQQYAHPDGGIEVPRAAARSGVRYVHSTFAGSGFADLAAIDSLRWWFQLYVFDDPGLNRALVTQAVEAGAEAVVVTVDLAVLGARERDTHSGFTLRGNRIVPCVAEAGREDARLAPVWQSLDHDLSMETLERTLADCPVPLLVKGVLRADDAVACVERGAAGVIVSNHGGRQIDTAVPTAEALAPVVDAVADRGEVLVDSGIRSGNDIAKALALGARSVLVGRPPMWGLGVAGAAGVQEVLRLLVDELSTAMALLGARSVAELDRGLLALGRPEAPSR
ncbi:MAG: alpha-hydroxy acid oxidase [Actinomycetota bacterium]